MQKVGSGLLKTFRDSIKARNLDAYLLMHGDAHQSEYLAPCDERIGFISGFTGSNGLCLTTQDKALMWTDGRYYLQASNQLYEGWEMMKMEAGSPQYWEWIKVNMPKGSTIGVDESRISAREFKSYRDIFKNDGFNLVPAGLSIVDEVWGESQPPMP
jgi:Xaa-Pro aminopeptidase